MLILNCRWGSDTMDKDINQLDNFSVLSVQERHKVIDSLLTIRISLMFKKMPGIEKGNLISKKEFLSIVDKEKKAVNSDAVSREIDNLFSIDFTKTKKENSTTLSLNQMGRMVDSEQSSEKVLKDKVKVLTINNNDIEA